MIADIVVVGSCVLVVAFFTVPMWMDRENVIAELRDARQAWRDANPKRRLHPRRSHYGKAGRAF